MKFIKDLDKEYENYWLSAAEVQYIHQLAQMQKALKLQSLCLQ